MDSDYITSALFFIAGTLILTFWLMSLVIAVVTTSFQVMRDEQQFSSFTGENSQPQARSEVREYAPSRAWRVWNHTRWFWVLLIVADLAVQASKTAAMSEATWLRFEKAETIFTMLFEIEILLRFASYFPRWRTFATHRNLFDLFLAVVTCLLQIPSIKNSGSLYRWLTVFQIMRAYRIIYAIPFTRDIVSRVLGKPWGLLNLIFFVFCAVYIAAIISCQLIRGDAPEDVYGEPQEMTFKNIFNSFIAMYQILSSENWTTILYAVSSQEVIYRQSWIGTIYFIVWFVFSQNIIMSMFIAVLQENFEVSEDDKRREQVRIFVQKSLPTVSDNHNTSLTMFSLLRNHRRQHQRASQKITQMGSVLHENSVREFLDQQIISQRTPDITMQDQLFGPFRRVWQILIRGATAKTSGAGAQPRNPFSSTSYIPTGMTLAAMEPHTIATQIAEAHSSRRSEQEQYLQEHPAYDKVLWYLTSKSRIRKACQKIVGPSIGERLDPNASPIPVVWYLFTAFMYLCTVALVVLACINTPTYQKGYHLEHAHLRFAWFTWCDLAFTLIFSVEFLIKVLADGFWLTPNAYFRNTWNRIDLFVLFSLWVNLIADILDRGSLSRAFRAFKALRALRLVNISDATKAVFYDVLIAGFWNIAGAAIVSLALLIPMAIWGLNMFAGQLHSCNDNDVESDIQCLNEFSSSPSNWNVWAPRSWENPQVWTFDSFGSSLLILFEIVSQEGWVDVMTSAMAITGSSSQPRQDASAINALFFIIFNLLGAVFVLTLFITVIIQNYSERSGVAFLTTEQRSWQEMRLLLKQVRPSRRPIDAPKTRARRWCFYAVKKQSVWNRCLIAVYCAHVILLMSEHYSEVQSYSFVRSKSSQVVSLRIWLT